MGIITVTENAAQHIQDIIDTSSDPKPVGLLLGVNSKGCSGNGYNIDYLYEHPEKYDFVEVDGVRVYVDPAALLFVIGSKMDWKDDVLSQGFTFENPNAIGVCGCGESFTIK